MLKRQDHVMEKMCSAVGVFFCFANGLRQIKTLSIQNFTEMFLLFLLFLLYSQPR